MRMHHFSLATAIVLAANLACAQEQVLNIYSARHYPSDEALYSGFTKASGIKINRVDADDAGIVSRLKAEGAASPADVILLVDAARLWRGEAEGLFQPVKSKVLDDAIPAQLRGKPAADGASAWYGFSTRARIVVYDKIKVKKEDVDTYEELGDPKNKGKLCIPITSPCLVPCWSIWVSQRRKLGSRAWWTTWPAPPRAVTPTRSRQWHPVNAALP